ncbi:MAG: tetratricopeptide repeat protein [Candidatus Omnitrophica bacterium]|nr:tetratricopeptide repeat protein [Candidatus Omnitrophota bacterium]
MPKNSKAAAGYEVIQAPWKNRLLKFIQDSDKSIFIISPFLKSESILWITNILLNKKIDKTFEINILTRINEKDVIDGRSDLESLEAIANLRSTVEFSVHLKSISNLHANAYIFDSKTIILTSANLTPDSFTTGIDYGLAIQEDEVVAGIVEDFNKYWEEALDVEPSNLKRFITNVRARLKSGALLKPPYMSIGTKIEPKGDDLKDIVEVKSDDLISKYLEQGMEAEESGEFEKALDLFNQILLLAPDNTEALENKARILIEELDRPNEAIECFDKMLALDSQEEHAWREKGKILCNMNRLRDALIAFDEASKLNPNSDEVWYWKGIILSKFESRREDAIACFDQAIYLNSYYEEAWYQKGLIFYKYLDKPKEALRSFQGTLRINPDHEPSMLNRGIVYFKHLNKPLEALKSIDKLTKQNTKHKNGWHLKGIIFSKAYKKHKEALICLDEALKFAPEDEHLLFTKGRILYKNLNEAQKALKCFDEVLKLNPENYFALLEKGLVQSENYRNVDDALQFFIDAIDIHSKSEIKGGVNASESELEEQDLIIDREGIFGELIKRLNDLTTNNPSNGVAWYVKAAILDKFLSSYEDALICLDESTKINPDYSAAWHDKGVILDSVYGRNEDAIKCYNKALSLTPDNEVIWYNKGNTLLEMENYNEALECFEKTLELNAELGVAWSNKGNVLIHLEKYEPALESFNHALKLNQDDIDSWYNKGNVLLNLKKFDEALQCFEHALNLNPTHESAAKNFEFYSDKSNWK